MDYLTLKMISNLPLNMQYFKFISYILTQLKKRNLLFSMKCGKNFKEEEALKNCISDVISTFTRM